MTATRPARLIALTLVSLMVVGGVLAAAPANAKPVDPTVTITILPAQVRLVPKESVVVRLATNITTGYSWSYRVVGNRSAVTVVQKEPAPPAPGALIGAPTTTDWVVTAKAPGTAVVRFFTTPPGGGDRQRVGSLTVIVRP
jgi:predicted secreted protein